MSPATLPPPRLLPLLAGWALFWLLMVTVALHDHARARPGQGWWPPLLWEGSSCLVASALLAWQWRRLPRLDVHLPRPVHWLGRALAELPLWAPLFVVVVYGLRHAVYALAGQTYVHDPWPQVLRYESLKFALFYLLFVVVLFGLRSHAAMLAERLRAEQQLVLTRQAQLTQLAQQIEPHFLFNALNTIAATVHTDAALADTLLTRLAALLRAATDLSRRPFAPLRDELALAQGYTQIMAERFGPRVGLRWELDPQALGCEVPTLMLQPLLENAFEHGVQATSQPVQVAVRARCAGGRLHIEVHNTGAALVQPWQPGVGLGNLQARLATAHGSSATLALHTPPQGGVLATVELPCGC